MRALGFETRVESSKTDGNEMNMIIAAKTEGARKVKVIAHLGPDGTYVVISYEGAK